MLLSILVTLFMGFWCGVIFGQVTTVICSDEHFKEYLNILWKCRRKYRGKGSEDDLS